VRTSDKRFLMHTLDLGHRGDIAGIIESLSLYFEDKRKYPWHRIFSILENALDLEKQNEVILALRESILSAFDVLSLGLTMNVSSENLLSIYLKNKSWKEGRKEFRSHCASLISSEIKKRNVYHLDAFALQQDGFSYLVSDLIDAEIDIFKKGRPEIKTKGKKKSMDLKKLHRSKYGRKLLRDHGISETELDSSDPRFNTILDDYELLQTDLEIDTGQMHYTAGPTEQVTLNGKPIEEHPPSEPSETAKEAKGVQKPLTEFLQNDSREKSKGRSRKKGRKTKKKSKKKGGA
jgi:hypothetical protein